MAESYIIEKRIPLPPRQEGDTGQIQFEVPEEIPMAGRTVTFLVVSRLGDEIMRKVSPTTITLSGQVITIPLLPADTKGKSGTHQWEMEFTGMGETITVGHGDITITKELIR